MVGRKRKDRTFKGFQQKRTRSDLCSSVGWTEKWTRKGTEGATYCNHSDERCEGAAGLGRAALKWAERDIQRGKRK